MGISIADDVRARLDAHLDAVEKALAEAKCSRERRRGVVDDLEAQIVEMLGKRSSVASLADLEAVLAALDPPGAYVDATSAGTTASATATRAVAPRVSRMATWACACVVASLFLLVTMLVLMCTLPALAYKGKRAPAPPPTEAVLAGPAAAPAAPPATSDRFLLLLGAVIPSIVVLPLPFLGTVLGWVAFIKIRSSNGALTGQGRALFAGLFYPVSVILLVLPALA